MKKGLSLLSSLALGALLATQVLAAPSPTGTSVWGDEAREVYNTLIAAGATRVDIPEGPTVIVDRIDCLQSQTGTVPATAKCKFQGDPKLNTAEGAIALRLVKALVGIGVKKKTTDTQTTSVGVSSLDCGILHNLPGQLAQLGEPVAEEASCYFVDNN